MVSHSVQIGFLSFSRSLASGVVLLCSLLLALGFLAATAAAAQERPMIVSEDQDHWSLLDTMQVSHAIPRSAAFEAVRAGDFDASFRAGDGSVPSFDGEAGPVWVKAVLASESRETLIHQIVLKYPQPQRITFYVEGEDGEFVETQQGSAAAYLEARNGRFPSARIAVPGGEARTFYLRIESPAPLLVPLQLYSQDGFGRAMTLDNLIFGLLVGCILAVAIHSFLTFAAAGEPAFGWFVLFCVCGAGYILTATGIAKALIYPGIAFNSNLVLMASQAIGNMVSALFLASYLRIREHSPHLHKLVQVIAVASVFSGIGVFLPSALAVILLVFSILIGPTALFGINVYLAVRGVKGAKALLVGWTLLQAGTVWLFLRVLDVVPYTEFNHYALPLAATFTALHFSWALTSRARRAEHQAKHDELTGLPNRLSLAAYGKDSASLDRHVAAMLQIDLDGFKGVNDTHGHAAGDHVLKVVSERFKAALHGDGEVFRLGGDEFAVVVSGKRNSINLVAVANRIITAAAQPVAFRGQTLRVGASVGIAIPASGETKLSDTLERADAALYEAKRDGKGCLRFCDLETERQALASALEAKAA
ncbi:MAG: diguanylate cyclase [Pseudomonadota bacterium]